ncbi:hypothetical protein ACSTKA_23180, partial [Vibrio parahaemolyticus]
PPGLPLAGDTGFLTDLRAALDRGDTRCRLSSAAGPVLFAAVHDGDASIVQAISIDQRMELVTLSTTTYAIAGAAVLLAVGVAGWFVTGRL